jgi:lysophospholipase L1-like esterase
MKKKVIFSLIPLVVIFSIFEIGLRLSPFDEYLSPSYRKGSLFDHCVFWKPEPVEHNPLEIYHDYRKQFRGVHHKKKKQEDILRIICLGGSSTWGWPLEDTTKIYPAVLEKLLNIHFKNKKFEVINAGVGGYSSFQDLMYLKYTLLEYNPDIITLCVGANDSNNNSDILIALTDKEYWEYLKAKNDEPLKTAEIVLKKLRSYLINLRVYNALDTIIFRIKNRPKRRVPIEDFKNNLNEILKLAESYNFKVLLITEAHKSPDAILEYIDVLERVSKNNSNAFFIDTRPFLEDDSYFVDEMHPTYEGHEIIAEVIFDAILGKKLDD